MEGVLNEADRNDCEQRLKLRRAALSAGLLERLRAGEFSGATAMAVDVHDWKDDAFADLMANLKGAELASVRQELDAIQVALGRIATGQYGSCSECERAIGRQRLLVQPSAERCVACQERAELGQRSRQ